MGDDPAEKPEGLAVYLPIVSWLPKYDKSWLKADRSPDCRCGRDRRSVHDTMTRSPSAATFSSV